jgi:hypothetical protein
MPDTRVHDTVAGSISVVLLYLSAYFFRGAAASWRKDKQQNTKRKVDEVVEKIRNAHKDKMARTLYLFQHIILTDLQFVVYDPNDRLDMVVRDCLYENGIIYISSKVIAEAPDLHKYSSLNELQVNASYPEGEENEYLVFFGGNLKEDDVRCTLEKDGYLFLSVDETPCFCLQGSGEYITTNGAGARVAILRCLGFAPI